MGKKIISLFGVLASIVLLSVTNAQAHVTVRPNEAGVAKSQIFTVSVPVEKDIPTVEVRLIIPEGVESVRPNAKSGWQIDMKKEGSGDTEKVTEIIWKNGNIPVGLRDEFIFSAKTPSKSTSLYWKAYQKYQDGTVISWDQPPKQEEDGEDSNSGPYSETKIVDDLSVTATPSSASITTEKENSPLLPLISVTSLAISIVALVLSISKKSVES